MLYYLGLQRPCPHSGRLIPPRLGRSQKDVASKARADCIDPLPDSRQLPSGGELSTKAVVGT